MRVADYIVEKLFEENCRHIYTVTGRGALFLTDALARHGQIEPVSVHHEQSASFAAMAYSQVAGEMGACIVSTGCAGTNVITGLLCAWQDDIPLIVISGQHNLNETVRHSGLPIRTFGQQEADIVSIVSSITKYATMITNPDDIVFEMEKALFLAKSGRKGPVWIDVPLDIQNMRIEPDKLTKYTPRETINYLSNDDISSVTLALRQAQRPLVLIGSGVRSACAEEQLNLFLNISKIPVVYTASATDIADPQQTLSVGCIGTLAGNRAANFAVQNSDLILVVGARLTSMSIGSELKKFARQASVIAVDIDPHEHQKHAEKIDRFILSDAKTFLKQIAKTTFSSNIDTWIDKCRHWKSIFPKCEERFRHSKEIDLYHLADILSSHLAENAVCISDSGLAELIIPTTVTFKKNQRAIHPASQGSMGYALPAAIGAYYAGKQQTVVVVGDGSIMMNLQELQTISHYNLPIKILVINNNCYAIIRKRQQDLFRTRTIGTDPENGVSCPSFEKIADTFNLQYEKISFSSELEDKLKKVLESEHAVLCEIMGKADQQYIHSSYRRTNNGRFVRPPIEDQSPFLERSVFLSEMLVEPIDQ